MYHHSHPRLATVLTKPGVVAILAFCNVCVGQPAPPACVDWREHTLSPRGQPSMAFDSVRSVVVLFGGYDHNNDGQTWEWDGQDWTLVATTGPAPRYGAPMAFDEARGVTVLYGDYSRYSPDLNETWEWDGESWQLRTSDGPELIEGAMAYDAARGVCVLFGGITSSNGVDTELVNQTWEWDGQTWTLRAKDGPSPRSASAMAYDPIHKQIVLFGGHGNGQTTFGDTWVWDGDTWTLSTTTGPSPRAFSAMTFDASIGRVVLFGGSATNATGHVAGTWAWDGAAWSQLAGAEPPARREHAIVYDLARDQVVLFGGRSHPGSIGDYWGDTWVRSSGAWQLADQGDPLHRQNLAMAYDSNRHVIVMFGGALNSYGQETWEYSVAEHAWTRMSLTGPPARRLSAMAFDSQRNICVLFGGVGGYDGTPIFGDTWEWDGSTWTQRNPVVAPSPRAAHSMVYDQDRGATLLYGGSNSDAEGRQTWEWDGETWTLRAINGPHGRSGAAMAYDSDRGVTVLFGGNGTLGIRHETWEWNGSVWTLRANTGPSSRIYAGMVYDTNVDLILMCGKYGGSSPEEWLWMWNGSQWSRVVSRGPKATGAFGMAFDSDSNTTVLFDGFVANETLELRFTIGPQVQMLTSLLSTPIGNSAQFQVSATGSGTLQYQWRRNGQELVDGAGISGVHTATLTVTPQGVEVEGQYDVLVADAACTQLSTIAWLNVITSNGDINQDGVVDAGDLQLVISQWTSSCAYLTCTADVTEDGRVDVNDLLFVIMRWSS